MNFDDTMNSACDKLGKPDQQIALGIDIGTTSISAAAVGIDTGRLYCACSEPHGTDMPCDCERAKLQDAERLITQAKRMLDALIERCGQVSAIGVTGQMHGIVYTDGAMNPLSPLYTWQDGRADAEFCKGLYELTGYRVAPGYGLATHMFLLRHGGIPEGAAALSTVMDLLAAKLCGLEHLVTHATNAASLGFFDLYAGSFDFTALDKYGVDPSLLPTVTAATATVGVYRGIPVAVAIGDNQASFLGSVSDEESSALANIGTGSQISRVTQSPVGAAGFGKEIELRPYIDGRYLLCGSALCGGRAYAAVERFFGAFAAACGLPDGSYYDILNRLAEESAENGGILQMRTTLCGTRGNPALRGKITGIGEDNLTPGALAAGCLYGMAGELHDMFSRMGGEGIACLVASGNAVRRNRVLLRALSDVFGTEVCTPSHGEEAAVGAAIFAGAAALGVDARRIAARCVRYDNKGDE